jgi:hypothetical protein
MTITSLFLNIMNNSLNCGHFILLTNSIFVFRTLDTEMLLETFPVKQKTSQESANDVESSKNELLKFNKIIS